MILPRVPACSLSVLCLLALAPAAPAQSLDGQMICVNRYASAPVIDQVMAGLEAGIAEAAAAEAGAGPRWNIQNPEADAGTQALISQQFAQGGCDVIVTVGTAATQAIQQATDSVPVVFLAVSTPVESGLVASLEAPGGNITGVADPLPVEAEIDGMLAIDPSIRTIGLIYRVGDPAGDELARRARARIEALGLAHVTAGIANPGETTQAAQSLVGRADAIQFPCDTTTISGVVGAMAVATENNLPAFGCTVNSVQAGAILAGSYNYVAVGHAAGALTARVLRGADPAETPVVVPDVAGFELNTTAAAQLGLTIPQAMLDAAAGAAATVAGADPVSSLLAGMACGALAGLVTALLHTRLRMNVLLTGILVTAACWSVSIMVMGSGNLSLVRLPSLFAWARGLGLNLQWASILVGGGVTLLLALALGIYLHTGSGMAMRATGLNIQTARGFGIRTEGYQIAGLMIANALAGASGVLVAQAQGFMDVTIQSGIIVVGLAALVIGTTLLPSEKVVKGIIAVILGVVLYRIVIAFCLRAGIAPSNLKLLTTVIVLGFIALRVNGMRLPFLGDTAGRRRRHLQFQEENRVAKLF